jgi:hypothetical protein
LFFILCGVIRIDRRFDERQAPMGTTTPSRTPRASTRKRASASQALAAPGGASALAPLPTAAAEQATEAVLASGTFWNDWWNQMLTLGVGQFARQMDMLDGLVAQQLQAWKVWEQSVAGLWHLPGLGDGNLHVSADSAGGVLVPPSALTPESVTRTAFGWAQAMSEAWLNAVQHDLEDSTAAR